MLPENPDSSSSAPRLASRLCTVVAIVAAILVGVGLNALVAWAAIALGADAGLMALQPATYALFTAAGLIIGYVGWRVTRRISKHPAATLRWLVPTTLILTWIPDLLLGATSPGGASVWIGVAALMVMHVTTLAVAIPTYMRVAPVK